jgi:hypothetical protein
MGTGARANRREKKRIALQVARAELILLLGETTKTSVLGQLLDLSLGSTNNLLYCLRTNGALPYWANNPRGWNIE